MSKKCDFVNFVAKISAVTPNLLIMFLLVKYGVPNKRLHSNSPSLHCLSYFDRTTFTFLIFSLTSF